MLFQDFVRLVRRDGITADVRAWIAGSYRPVGRVSRGVEYKVCADVQIKLGSTGAVINVIPITELGRMFAIVNNIRYNKNDKSRV